MKRPELLLAAVVVGFVGFVVAAARDVRRTARRDLAPAPALAVAVPDSGDESAPEAAPARPDAATVAKMLEAGAPGTYIGAILDAQNAVVIRWLDRTFDPLTVWIQPASDVPDFFAEAPLLVRDAFDRWIEPATPMRFTFVVDSARAMVHVTWVDRFKEEIRIGTTRITHGSDGVIVDADIELALHDSSGRALPSEVVRAAALHEVGHLLGLNHSPDSTDIMFETATSETREITRADRRTLQLLYRLPPGPTR